MMCAPYGGLAARPDFSPASQPNACWIVPAPLVTLISNKPVRQWMDEWMDGKLLSVYATVWMNT